MTPKLTLDAADPEPVIGMPAALPCALVCQAPPCTGAVQLPMPEVPAVSVEYE